MQLDSLGRMHADQVTTLTSTCTEELVLTSVGRRWWVWGVGGYRGCGWGRRLWVCGMGGDGGWVCVGGVGKVGSVRSRSRESKLSEIQFCTPTLPSHSPSPLSHIHTCMQTQHTHAHTHTHTHIHIPPAGPDREPGGEGRQTQAEASISSRCGGVRVSHNCCQRGDCCRGTSK